MTQEPQDGENQASKEQDAQAGEEDYPIGKMLCALGVVLCGLLMFTLPLSKVFLAIDMATHFALHYMVVGAALLAGFFVPRWHLSTAIVLTIAGLFLIGYAATHKSAPVEQPVAAGEKRLQLMTFNTWLRNRDWKSVAREITDKGPDVVALLEFGNTKSKLLRFLKKQYPHQISCLKIHYCHMAILSKIPFKNHKVQTRWRGPPYVRVSFGSKLGGLTLFAVHTIRPPYYRAHYKQIGALANAVNNQTGLKVVMGDFNSTPFSRTLNTFASRTKLKRLTDTPSWPAYLGNLPQVAIDHIFVSPKIRELAPHRLGNNAGSDHFPVNIVVAVPQS